MLRILHLSDLHLGTSPDEDLGDYKTEVIERAQRHTRQGHLKNSLAALSRHNVAPLDAIVISGDIAYQSAEGGFTELTTVLDMLGDKAPPKDRILVVPGNHDVIWDSDDSTNHRYDLFLKYVRNAGFRTPLLDGIDIAANGRDLGIPHDPIVDLGSVALIGVNSAHYCGTLEELKKVEDVHWRELETKWKADSTSPDGRIYAELLRLRCHDMCRVSTGQINALQARLALLNTSPWRVRIVVLHHHLVPVSDLEEVKPFESMTNLGEFRHFLAAQDVRIVLHGHKHSPNIQVDVVSEENHVNRTLQLTRPPVLISSASRVGAPGDDEAFRLVEVDDEHPTLRHVVVRRAPAVPAGQELPQELLEVGSSVCLRSYQPSEVSVYEGRTVDEVYAQLRLEFTSDEIRANVVCRIHDGSTALHPPSEFPAPPGEEKGDWFRETIDWWQSSNPRVSHPHFNHGQRIHNYRGDNIDQLKFVTRVLDSPKTSRAVVVLYEPRQSDDDAAATQPAFCLLQFRVADGHVHCTGYFRKQQMRAWWPINVGEMARMQKQVAETLTLKIGEIVTIAAIALGGTDRARVIVPWVDRASDEELWSLALSTFDRERMPDDVTDLQARWRRVFSDWRPEPPRERDGVPLARHGLEQLAKAVSAVSNRYESAVGTRVGEALRRLFERNEGYWREESRASNEDDKQISYDNWRGEVDRLIKEVSDELDHVFDPSGSTPEVSKRSEPRGSLARWLGGRRR